MILTALHLSKSFSSPSPVSVLSDICLEVLPGQSIAICGRSGEGKTTLLHLLGTLEKPDNGELLFKGKPIENSTKLRRDQIGFVFQSYNLLEDFTVLDNLLMPAWIARRHADPKRGLALLEEVGLAERIHFPAKLLSGGEKQRLAIARSLFNDPDLILADEPTGNLDRVNAALVGKILLDCVQKRGKSVIIATHDQELASLCQSRYELSQGVLKKIY